MRAVVQRVSSSKVSVDGVVKGEVGKGFNVLLGVTEDDTEFDAEILAAKVAKLRIFEDDAGKMNLSILDIDGEILVISQFTLCADLKKGNRPSFVFAARPEKAVPLYEYFMSQLKENGVRKIEHGVFAVEINNDGPVTIMMDTTIWRKS